MAARSAKLYGDSPEIKRGDDGAVGIHKPKKADAIDAGIDGMPTPVHQANERREMKHRHVAEHMAMHNKHETEHGAHAGGDKAEMHGRHHAELKAMHGRHESELKSMHGRHEKGGGGKLAGTEGKKIEKDAKAEKKAA